VTTTRTDLEIRPGHPASSIVVHVPHAGTRVPAEVRVGIDLGDDDLRREVELMADAGTDLLAASALYPLPAGPSMVVNRLSRLVVDPERFVDGTEELDAVGMGAVYTRTHDGRALRRDDAAERQALIDRYFAPYTAAMESTIGTVLDRHDRCTILDLHSYPRAPLPYELRPDADRPEVCIGTDPEHTPPALAALAAEVFAEHGFETGVNLPFAGAYVPAPFHRTDLRVRSVMVEVRRDLYLRDGIRTLDPAGSRRVAHALRALIASMEVVDVLEHYASTILDIDGLDPSESLHGIVITACNPYSAGSSSPQDDEAANADLRRALADHADRILDVDAHAPEPDDHREPSFYVPGMDLATACAWGRRYEQRAVFDLRDGMMRVVDCAAERVLFQASALQEQREGIVRFRADGRP
jgi:N-formylglutamate deformylase